MDDPVQYIAKAWPGGGTTRNGIPFKDADQAGFTQPGWYFWDETEAFCHGPYKTLEEAREKLDEYGKQL